MNCILCGEEESLDNNLHCTACRAARVFPDTSVRACSICGVQKRREHFPKCGELYCKLCKNAKRREYSKQTQNRRLEYARDYYYKNKEKVLARQKLRYERLRQ